MAFESKIKIEKIKTEKYDCYWSTGDPLEIEMECIRRGGKWRSKVTGKVKGMGLFYHYREMQKLLWPSDKWHKWKELMLSEFVVNRLTGVMGAASSAKSHEAALFGLCTYYCNPNNTSVLVSSTDVRSLELRIWGEIKKYHDLAQQMAPGLPGKVIHSRQMIVTTDEDGNSGDFRNGIIGIPCVVGGNFVGLGKLIGIKNKIVVLIADELSVMGPALFDSIANLNKNPGFKGIGLGNPKDRNDALGMVCEPADADGGWDAVDTTPKTKTWKTRFPNGKAIQLVGTDSPNFDVPEGVEPPFPFLITREAIETDRKFYGEDSMQFQMMDMGMMPKESVARRVITRAICTKFHAKESVIWGDGRLIKVAGLDAAYSSVGGDRCVLIMLEFGADKDGVDRISFISHPIVIPVRGGDIPPEDQIAQKVRQECELKGVDPSHLYYDSTGRGTLGTAFARQWSNAVNPVEFGGRATERMVSTKIQVKCRDYYTDFVTELWYSVRHVIEADQMRNMPDEVIAEGVMREWTIVKGNKIEVEAKVFTKKRMGRSPDVFDSLVCAIEGARRLGFKVANLYTDKQKAESENWLDLYRKRINELRRRPMLTFK